MIGTSVKLDDSRILARRHGLWNSNLLVIASGVSRLFLKRPASKYFRFASIVFSVATTLPL